jgi:hypothetical protein
VFAGEDPVRTWRGGRRFGGRGAGDFSLVKSLRLRGLKGYIVWYEIIDFHR